MCSELASLYSRRVCTIRPYSFAKWSGLGSIENIVCVCGLVLSKAHLEGPEGVGEPPARSQMQALVTVAGLVSLAEMSLRVAMFTGTRVVSEG